MGSVFDSGYYGTYEQLENIGPDESARLRGNATVIGQRLSIELLEDEDGERCARVIAGTTSCIGELPSQVVNHLFRTKERGWSCFAALSYIWFDGSQNLYIGEVAVIAYSPERAEIIERYATNLLDRISKGEHPTPRLSDHDLNRLVESNGTWNDAKSVSPPKFKKGSNCVPYQTKRTFATSLASSAAAGKAGCKVGTFLVYAVLLAVVALIIWRIFFA